MLKNLKISFLIFFLITTNATAQSDQIEVFDIGKGKVMAEVERNPEIQQEVEKYLKTITGVYPKVRPIPSAGLMVKIPLEPAVKVHNQWLTEIVDEVIIIFPPQEEPHIMVFDDENRSYFFTFKANADTLLKNLNLKNKH